MILSTFINHSHQEDCNEYILNKLNILCEKETVIYILNNEIFKNIIEEK